MQAPDKTTKGPFQSPGFGTGPFQHPSRLELSWYRFAPSLHVWENVSNVEKSLVFKHSRGDASSNGCKADGYVKFTWSSEMIPVVSPRVGNMG